MIKTTNNRLRVIILSFSVILSTSISDIKGQVLQDPGGMDLIKKGVDHIYGFRFREAEEVCSEVSMLFPGHPVNYLLRGLITYWENFPLLPSSPERINYEEYLRKCIEICENEVQRNEDPEFLLAKLSAKGLLMVFYSDNDLSREVTPLVTQTYRNIRQSFSYTSECTDLYYFTGLYNYYRDAYPRIYPVYKTVAFLFPPGDSQKGLNELEKSARESFVLSAESYFMLYWIYMNYENDYIKSLSYIKFLNQKYPDNLLHRIMLIKNLLLIKQYDEAESLMNNASPDAEGNHFCRAVYKIFEGLLQEKKYKNNSLAWERYLEGLKGIEQSGAFGDEFASYAYFGLSRISVQEDKKKSESRIYRRKAIDLADFKRINFDN